ncbi:STAS domain-containing protein [Desulfovibrio sp. OttesenSCG-928-G15]|nr:STAS domain-containing protein [Desulfovibrio sp. OttesenSCG-928-G15]
MEITVTHIAPVYKLCLSGRWDAFTAKEFESLTGELVHDKSMRFVVLDLSNVDYVSSFGLRSLLGLGKTLEPLGGAIHVAALRPQVEKVFVGCGFGSLFPTFADADAAAAAFSDRA